MIYLMFMDMVLFMFVNILFDLGILFVMVSIDLEELLLDLFSMLNAYLMMCTVLLLWFSRKLRVCAKLAIHLFASL